MKAINWLKGKISFKDHILLMPTGTLKDQSKNFI